MTSFLHEYCLEYNQKRVVSARVPNVTRGYNEVGEREGFKKIGLLRRERGVETLFPFCVSCPVSIHGFIKVSRGYGMIWTMSIVKR